MRLKALILLTAASALSAFASADMPKLTPGMPAPKLEVAGWLKYDAPAVQPGHFRVVEFWATWCGPCKTSIPHLTEMAHKFKDKVDFVGVSVYEHQGTTVDDLKKFVADMGEKMDYRVAYDTEDKKMAHGWMEAAGQNGIPASFLLNDQGQVLWVGHPMELEKPLEDAIAGKLDVEANKTAFLKAAAEQEEAQKTQMAISAAAKLYATDKAGAEKAWNEAAAKSPMYAQMVDRVRLQTYPAGTPESDGLIEKLMATPSGQQSVGSFGLSQVKRNPTVARAVADKVAAKAEDAIALYYAGLTYNGLDAFAEAIKTFDSCLTKYSASGKELNGFKEAVTKAREAAVAKAGNK